MTTMIGERLQRWAAFSVRAHRDLASLAADILLYDRIILPVPEDEPEYERWVRKQWNPADIALRVVQAAGHIIPVPWTTQLRAQWQNRWDELKGLGAEVAYGITGFVYASYPPAWDAIAASLQKGERPKRRPAILAGYQSAKEAKAELGLRSVNSGQESKSKPGGRPVDRVVALHVHRMVHEPDIADPNEAFLTAVALAEKPKFQKARRNLFDLEDALFVDGWKPDEVEKELRGLEEDYRDAVRAECKRTLMRQIATVLPKLGGWAAVGLGHPHAKGAVSKSLSFVTGRFISMQAPPGAPVEETHPGAALAMIRAAYRNQRPEPRQSGSLRPHRK